MYRLALRFLGLLAVGSLVGSSTLRGQVKMWEEDLIIPTWQLGSPEVNPTFAWSSPRQEVYPYPYKETLTDRKTDQTYRACWLENEFIRVLILPEIGGRLHGARDKTNDYNFFYWQPTIKPALVGMTGAWISGGIEWNFPHGHRPTGFSPVQHRLVENADGSMTVWVGEMELVHRMRWIVGLTVYPGKSVIEARVRLMNSTPVRHSFQMWTTTAVNANEDYQAVFPTRLMTGHGKFEYFHWPVHEDVDISWWKNVPNAASFFAVEPGEFFGGWDHGRNAGTVITGDPHLVVGKKFWTWGTSPFGRIWEPILTEGEGPYIEPQAGAYSDNQPDYHWLEPGEVKSYSHFFFPVRDIGPFKKANVHGALNLEFHGNAVKLGAYSTAVLPSARVELAQGGEVVFSELLDLDPSQPFVRQIEVENASNDREAFTLSLSASGGKPLLSYSPRQPGEVSLPEPARIFPDPGEVATNDELWHAGDITYKFRDPAKGRAYFEEAIRRDPGDSRSRVTLAELDIKQALYSSALRHLKVAEMRDPDNGKVFYLRAVAEEALGDFEGAYKHYYRSAHFESYLARAYDRVARLDLRKRDFQGAADLAELALQKNWLNPQLWALKATALRLAGAGGLAEETARKALQLDPLHPWAANELRLSLIAQGKPAGAAAEILQALLMGDSRLGLEMALHYAGTGLYEEALETLEMVPSDALTKYYTAFWLGRLGRSREEEKALEEARSASVDGVFAFRPESIEVLENALKTHPEDGRAHYYLGLVYAKLNDTDKAKLHWETATRLDPGNARAWRNLGLVLWKAEGNPARALVPYEKAFDSAREDSRILLELDEIREAAGVDRSERLAFLKSHHSVVKQRDALITRMVDLLIEQKDYAEALSHLEANHFNSWEGGYSIHNSYIEANVGLAEAAEDPEDALKYYQQACQYPENLEVAPREPDWRGFLYYPMSRLYRELGNEEESKRLLGIVAAESSDYPTLVDFFRAMALRDLGRKSDADEVLEQLRSEADGMLQGTSGNYRRMEEQSRIALGRYYLSRYFEATGDATSAKESLIAALEKNPGAERRAVMLAQRVFARAHQ